MDFRNMHGRGVVLDCVAKDGSGRVFNVGAQQDDEGAHPKRARYHLGVVDSMYWIRERTSISSRRPT